MIEIGIMSGHHTIGKNQNLNIGEVCYCARRVETHSFSAITAPYRLNCYVEGIQYSPIHQTPLPNPHTWFGTRAEVCKVCAQKQEEFYPLREDLCICKQDQHRRWLCAPCIEHSLQGLRASNKTMVSSLRWEESSQDYKEEAPKYSTLPLMLQFRSPMHDPLWP